jgi:hypothetical protein
MRFFNCAAEKAAAEIYEAEGLDEFEDIARAIVAKPELVKKICAESGVSDLSFMEVVEIIKYNSAINQADERVNGVEAEEFARALDVLGWKIVSQDDDTKWPMDPEYGPVPEWANDNLSGDKHQKRRDLYKLFPPQPNGGKTEPWLE